MRYRQTGQSTSEELREKDGKEYRRELEEKERAAREARRARRGPADAAPDKEKRPRIAAAAAVPAPVSLDADEPLEEEEEDAADAADSDEDDTAELMAELSRIKAERAAEKAEKEAVAAAEEERIRTENILHGNPLLSEKSDFKVARRSAPSPPLPAAAVGADGDWVGGVQMGRRRGVQELREGAVGEAQGSVLHQRRHPRRVPQEVHGALRQMTALHTLAIMCRFTSVFFFCITQVCLSKSHPSRSTT